MKRQNGANCSMLFSLSYKAHCLIDAPNCHAYKATCSDQRKKSVKYNLKFLNIWWLMPLFLILFILVSHSGVAKSTLDIHYFCLGFVLWTFLEIDWKLFLLLKRMMNER